jgi:hypothetical protein
VVALNYHLRIHAFMFAYFVLDTVFILNIQDTNVQHGNVYEVFTLPFQSTDSIADVQRA